MSKPDVRKRAMGIMARIQAATARHDPSYKLKKRGMLNAHDMKRLIPTLEELIWGVDGANGATDPIKISGMAETDIKKLYPKSIINYALNDVINTTDVVKHFKG